MHWLLDKIGCQYEELCTRVHADVMQQEAEEAQQRKEREERVRKIKEERERLVCIPQLVVVFKLAN